MLSSVSLSLVLGAMYGTIAVRFMLALYMYCGHAFALPCRGGSRGGVVGLQPPQNICIVLPARVRMRVCTYVDIDLVDVTRTRNY